MTTEIETVTVDFEDLRRNVDHYFLLRKTKRVEIVRDGEQILVLGPWLPGEKRDPAPEGFMRDLREPLIPLHPDEPNFYENLYAYLRKRGFSI
jgi:hypothetical protein